MRSRLLALTLLLEAAALPVGAGKAVRIDLPVPAQLAVSGRESVAIVPFLAVRQEESAAALPELEAELQCYLVRILGRGTELRVRSVQVDPPTTDPEALAVNAAFWQAVGDRTDADLVLAGAVDFDYQDRSGYVTREFVSDVDGRTHYVQELVEATGVELDLLVWVFDAATGELLLAENLKDFRAFRGESLDPLSGLFSNLGHLEERLLGIFATRTVRTERLLQ